MAGFLPRYRVLDLTDEWGTFGGRLLAELGLDVIKVEPPAGGKERFRGPFIRNQIGIENSLYFRYFNAGKRSITLDLHKEDGRVVFKRLVEGADVLLESFPPGYLGQLGLGYEALKKTKPDLVMASITPFGQTGPYRDFRSSDLIAMAMSGYMQTVGDPEGPPFRLGNEQSHFPPSQYGVLAILAALYHRNGGGGGEYIDVSVQEALLAYSLDSHAADMWFLFRKNITRLGHVLFLATCGLYPCKGDWVSLCTLSEAEWVDLSHWIYEVTGNEDVISEKYRGGIHNRAPYRDLITAYIMDFTARFTKEELFKEGQRRRVAVMPSYNPADLLNNEHLNAAGFYLEMDDPVIGRFKLPRATAIHFKGFSLEIAPAPCLGEHNEDIYCRELSFPQEKLAIFRSAGIV